MNNLVKLTTSDYLKCVKIEFKLAEIIKTHENGYDIILHNSLNKFPYYVLKSETEEYKPISKPEYLN